MRVRALHTALRTALSTALLAACACTAARSSAASARNGLAARLDRLEKHMLFLHERVAESICGDPAADGAENTHISSSGAWCLNSAGEVFGHPIAPFHFLDQPLAAFIYDKLLVNTGSVLDIGAGSGQVRACACVGALPPQAAVRWPVRWPVR